MSVFDDRDFSNHEEVRFIRDAETGLKAVVAIHSTQKGPALGGLRMRPYGSEAEAVNDVLRLSRGMSYKSAILKLNYGGGKGAIIGDPKRDKTEELLESMGTAIQNFSGRWFTGEDANITLDDAEILRRKTDFIIGTKDGGGDPAPFTAYGVFCAIKAGAYWRLGRNDLEGLTVAVQGVGAVGFHLCKMLHEAGAKLIVADTDVDKLSAIEDQFAAEISAPERIYDAEADVFAPCAFGAVINDKTVAKLKATIVAGAANNQLAHIRNGDQLHERGILYVPDYLANSAGLMNIVAEIDMRIHQKPYEAQAVRKKVETIYDRALEICERSKTENLPTSRVCDRIAEEWLNSNC